MNNEELEHLLKSDRAEIVLDNGFSHAVIRKLPTGARRRKPLIVPVAFLLGALIALLLPSGAGALLAAMQEITSGQPSYHTLLMLMVPLLLVLTAAAVLVAEEK